MFNKELLLIDDEELERCLLASESFEIRILRPSSVIGLIFIGNCPPLDELLVNDVLCLFVDVDVLLAEGLLLLSFNCLFDCDFFI